MSETDFSSKTSTAYSRHLLKCISKFLPNNPNFCPSLNEIGDEDYYKKCVKNLLALCMDYDTSVLVDDIIKLLKDKLSKYEEFPIIQEDEDLSENTTSNHNSKVASPNSGSDSRPFSKHGSPFASPVGNTSAKDSQLIDKTISPSASLPNISAYTDINNNPTSENIYRGNPQANDTNNESYISEATLRLLDKHKNIRKSTKYPLRSLGISNYVLIFLRLMIQIFEVSYYFKDSGKFANITVADRNKEFEDSYHFFYSNSPTSNLFKFGISKTNSDYEKFTKVNKSFPEKLHSKTFRKLIRFLIAIKSNVKLDDCVAKIVKEDQLLLPNMKDLIFKSLKTSSIHVASNGSYLSHDDEKLDSIPYLKETRNIIDTNIEYILFFIANSNVQDYMQFLDQILLINPGPEAKKDKFVLQELRAKYVQHQELDDIETERFINEELNNDNYSLNTAFSSASANSNGDSNPKYILIPAYLSLFTADLLFSTEYISFATFHSIKDLIAFIQFIHKLHKTYKRSIFRKCMLLALAHSLKIFFVSKTSDYLKYTHNNNTPEGIILKKELTNIFNSVYGSFDTLRLINDIYGNSSGNTINYRSNTTKSSPLDLTELDPFDSDKSINSLHRDFKLSERSNTAPSFFYSSKEQSFDQNTNSKSSNFSNNNEAINEMTHLLNRISEDGLTLSSSGDAYHFGTCNIEEELLNPGDIAVTRSLTMLSLYNVDVFSSYLNKVDFKGVDGGLNVSDLYTPNGFPPPTENKLHKPITSFVKNLKVKTDNSDKASINSFTDETSSSSSIPSSFIGSHLESQTKNVGSAIKNIIKISKLPNYYNTNKENKFWSNMMKHFGTSQALEISDRSNIHIFSILMLVYFMGGLLNIYEESSPITKFAKRISPVLSMIFQSNNNQEVPKQMVYAQQILNRNLPSKTKFVVENIISSLLLFPDSTVDLLENKCLIASKDQEFGCETYYELYCMSEGIKFFFTIPNPSNKNVEVYKRIVEVVKNMTFNMSGKLITSLDYLDKDASKVIDDIIFEKYNPEEQNIYYFVGKRNENVLEKFFKSNSEMELTKSDFEELLKLKPSIESSLMITNTPVVNKYSVGSDFNPNINLVNVGSQQEYKLREFLAVSLISNSVNILRTCENLTKNNHISKSAVLEIDLTEKILLSGILSSDEKLVKECVACYHSFLQKRLTEMDTESLNSYFWSLGMSALLLSICTFNLSLPESTRLTILQILEQLLKHRKSIKMMIADTNAFSYQEHTKIYVVNSLHEALFRSILVNLSFNEVKAHDTLRSLCSFYTDEVDYYCFYKKITPCEIDSCYYSFAKSIANCHNVFGPIAFQRHIRADILKYIDRPSRALFDCFLVFCDKIFDMCIVGQCNLLRDDQTRFRNYCGILTSFIGVFKIKFLSSSDTHKILDSYEVLISKKIDFFIERQCELLNSSDLLTRENSKDILSTELHPGCFSILFKKLGKKLKIFAEMCKKGEIEKNFFLLEQVLAVMRSILERNDISLIILCTKSVLDIIQKVLDIISMMDYRTHYKYKVIIHTSKAILSFKHAEKFFFTKGAHGLKNYWLQNVFSWFNEVAFVDLDLVNLTKSHREMDLEKRDFDYLRLDTSIECVKVLSFLTDKIALEAPAATTAVDLEISKRSAFANYFNILLKALERSSDHESVPFVLRHKTLILNENVLSCLTNLLISTPDIGLDFVLPIAYSENNIIRRTLLDVLIELTKNVGKDKLILTPAQEEAVNNLAKQSLKTPQILQSLASQCPVYEIERLATSLLKIWGPKNLAHIFISDLIEKEIAKVSRNMDILRRNSLATRTLAIFSRIKGNDFLNQTIKPLLSDILIEGLDFEIEKPIVDLAEREIQLNRFINCMDTFCDNILTSFDCIPNEFLYISQRIYSSAKRKFPGSELIAVGSFIFLRFFCPAIINPEAEKIKTRISSKNRRTLILVAKVLQNLANKTINSLKWHLLDNQQEKINEWSEKMFTFLQRVSDDKIKVSIVVDYTVPVEKLENLGAFHKILYSKYVEIRTSMIQDVNDSKSFYDLIASAKVVDEAMLELGQPSLELNNDIPKTIRDNAEKYSLVYDFMNRYYLKVGSMPEVSGLIFVSADADGTPRINLSLKLMEMDNVDVNEVVYKLIFLESGLWTKKFNILVDGTAAAASSTEKLERIMGLFMNLVPRDSFINLESIIFYNINEAFLLFWWNQARKAYESFGFRTIKHEFLTSNCSSQVFKSLQLQKYSVDIYNDVRVTLYNTSYYESSKNRFIPVTLKIGNNSIQLVRETPKRIKFNENESISECCLNDVYFIKNMIAASATNTTGIPYEFTITFNDETELILSTHKYLEILKILHYAKTKLVEERKLSGSADIQVKKENTNDSELDIIARLALVTLSGFSSKDEHIKSSAYSLLAVTKTTFNLETDYDPYPIKGLSLPDDTLVLTRTLTKQLALTKPEMTYFVLKHSFEGILSGLLSVDTVELLSLLSFWIENVHDYVFMDFDNNGKDKVIDLIRLLIKCTLDGLTSMSSFKFFIWSKLMLVSDLLEIIADEVITHAMDRESEGFDWFPCISILSMIPSVFISGIVIQRLLKLINKLIPTLTNDNNVNSWSEVVILVSVLQDLSFDSCVSFEGFIPEVLYIISMLIDVRPIRIKTSLHKLLINICNSFISSSGFSDEKRNDFVKCIDVLTSPKAKYVFGLSRENSNSYYSSNAAALLSKVNYMSELIKYMLMIMQIINKDSSDEILWKAKYKDLILEAIFGEESYISARAMMYLSILCREGVYEDLMKNLFSITLNVLTDVANTEETMLHLVTHVVSYGNFVVGLSDVNVRLIVQVSWLCHSFLMSPSIVVFHAGLVAATECLQRLITLENNTGLKINDIIWESNRQGLGDCLTELEMIDERFNTKENFLFSQVHLVCKATLISHTRSYGIRLAKMLLMLTMKEDAEFLASSDPFNCYMFLLFILQNNEEFDECYSELHNGEMPIYKCVSKDFIIPEFLFSWMTDANNKVKNMILYQISLLVSAETLSEATKLKILCISLHMAQNDPLTFFEYMSSVIEEAANIEEKGTLYDLVSKSFELLTAVVTSEYYHQVDMLEQNMTQRLKDMKLEALSDLKRLLNVTRGYSNDEKVAILTMKRRKCLIQILEKIVEDEYS